MNKGEAIIKIREIISDDSKLKNETPSLLSTKYKIEGLDLDDFYSLREEFLKMRNLISADTHYSDMDRCLVLSVNIDFDLTIYVYTEECQEVTETTYKKI